MKLYCGTYAKYNNGSIFGAWLNLNDYEDASEFYKACRELHKDEEDPELMFQDYEADQLPQSICDKIYCESCGSAEEFYKIKEKLEEDQKEYGYDFEELEEMYANDIDPQDVEAIVKDTEEYFQQLAEDCGYLGHDNPLLNYVD